MIVGSLADRLGLPDAAVSRAASGGDLLGPADGLFDRAFAAGPTDPASAQVLLAAALLSRSQESSDGRLKTVLCLLARLAGKAPVDKSLGPLGRAMRDDLLPSGWKETTKSWPKIRYAWREGLSELLDPPDSEEATVEALNELTRMHANEQDPVPVAIQEVWPSPPVTLALSLIGTALAIRPVVQEVRTFHRKRLRRRR